MKAQMQKIKVPGTCQVVNAPAANGRVVGDYYAESVEVDRLTLKIGHVAVPDFECLWGNVSLREATFVGEVTDEGKWIPSREGWEHRGGLEAHYRPARRATKVNPKPPRYTPLGL